MSFSLLFVVCCSLLSIDYYLALKWIGWVVSFAGIRRLCAWVRSNIVRRRVDWSGMARYKHCFVYAQCQRSTRVSNRDS
jgi:hypothetical protein